MKYKLTKFFTSSNNKNAQITIFVLIGILIMLLIVFLMFSTIDEKKDNLEKGKDALVLEDNSKLNILKSKVDYCLELQLKRASIVSGLRGGFIYNDGEYYFPGTIPQNTYNEILISNMRLNWNYLTSSALVHSQAQVYTPGINEDVFMYNHSIKEDMHSFVMKGFIECLNFDDTKGIYDVNFTKYMGTIEEMSIGSNQLGISGLDAQIDDIVEIDINDKILRGNVTNYYEEEDLYRVKFENLTILGNYSAEEIINMRAFNMNNSLNLSLYINAEDISGRINYPVMIKRDNFKTYYQDVTVTINVRYKSLLDFSLELLSHKYLKNKSIDYTNSTNIEKVLNKSRYFRSSKFKNLELYKKLLVDENERKRYIYSLVDYDSKIIGSPFVLNFGYENIAPTIDFNELDSDIISQKNSSVIRIVEFV